MIFKKGICSISIAFLLSVTVNPLTIGQSTTEKIIHSESIKAASSSEHIAHQKVLPPTCDFKSADNLKEIVSTLNTKDEILSVLGEPSEQLVDSMSNAPLWKYNFCPTGHYQYQQQMDAVDIVGLLEDELTAIIYVSFLNDFKNVNDFAIYYKDSIGEVKEYRRSSDGTEKEITI
ncbi:hypothetical protein SM124_05585 [Bacillus sp. 31A1R]|uniref:Lipoprotein SmpA/OmlA domain-containing protein n=1 Tax=Robertmurraya mangrovi TaxID=3098077 RepID=A0ABU5IVN6_9BACI|nr:hypothetical protein [Bacillus sp. 31A1R]MDZ5471212.1 hypothetical protein [Bacillus sp. 31A1R]